jgi:hypothetical protein
MNVTELINAIQASGIAEWMRTSLKAMPLIEAAHVLAAATVFGTILIVDLRLLGIPHVRRAFTRVSDELLTLTWSAFAVAVVTGALMFSANANTYYINTAFRLKMLALLAAGINMLIFQNLTRRSVEQWNQGVPCTRAARVAGLFSILLWTTVIFLARWIGFTKGYDFTVPEDVQFTF